MGNKDKIIAKKKTIEEAAGDISRHLEEYRGKLAGAREELKPEFQKEIDRLQKELDIHNAKSQVLGELLDIGSSGDHKIIIPRQELNAKEFANQKHAYEGLLKDIPKGESSKLLEGAINDNIAKSEQSHAAIDDYLESFRTNARASATFRFAQITGLIMAAASLGLAVTNYLMAIKPKPPEKPKNVAGPSPGGGGSSGEGINWGAPGAAQAGASSSEAPPELSADEIEDLMQGLFVNKAVIAAGKVPQDSLWQNLASQTDNGDLEAHNLTLMFIQESAVDLPGARDFFWLDPSDMAERYQALRQAHKKSGKLSDVYLEATKIEYNGEKVPTFHVALLLQLALRLIKHDLLYPNAQAT